MKYFKVDYRTTTYPKDRVSVVVATDDDRDGGYVYNRLQSEIPHLREIYKVEVYIGITKPEIDLSR